MVHKGDIVLNRWAGYNNPARIFIVEHIGKEMTKVRYEVDGNLRSGNYYTKDLKEDKEHFVVIGNLNYEKPMIERLRAEKARADNA